MIIMAFMLGKFVVIILCSTQLVYFSVCLIAIKELAAHNWAFLQEYSPDKAENLTAH